MAITINATERIFSFTNTRNWLPSGDAESGPFSVIQEFQSSDNSAQTNQGKAINPASSPRE
jgi:hypothetical protein